MSLFHRQNKVKVHSDLDIICNYQDCNKRFGSQPSLSRHKKIESHTPRGKPNLTKSLNKKERQKYHKNKFQIKKETHNERSFAGNSQ